MEEESKPVVTESNGEIETVCVRSGVGGGTLALFFARLILALAATVAGSIFICMFPIHPAYVALVILGPLYLLLLVPKPFLYVRNAKAKGPCAVFDKAKGKFVFQGLSGAIVEVLPRDITGMRRGFFTDYALTVTYRNGEGKLGAVFLGWTKDAQTLVKSYREHVR